MTHVLAYCRLSGYPGDRADYAAEPLASCGESRNLVFSASAIGTDGSLDRQCIKTRL